MHSAITGGRNLGHLDKSTHLHRTFIFFTILMSRERNAKAGNHFNAIPLVLSRQCIVRPVPLNRASNRSRLVSAEKRLNNRR